MMETFLFVTSHVVGCASLLAQKPGGQRSAGHCGQMEVSLENGRQTACRRQNLIPFLARESIRVRCGDYPVL